MNGPSIRKRHLEYVPFVYPSLERITLPRVTSSKRQNDFLDVLRERRSVKQLGGCTIEKLSEYTQSNFFKNNYDIRERHREAVMNDLMRRYPQCEPVREQVVTFYNSLFVKRMVAVNNVVYEWQKAAH